MSTSDVANASYRRPYVMVKGNSVETGAAVRRTLCAVALAMLALLWSAPAAAQVVWDGWHIGADIGGAFRTLDFSVNLDTTPGHSNGVVNGQVTPRLNVGGRVGFGLRVGKAIVLGGEFGLGGLGYYGSTTGGVGAETVTDTWGGMSWFRSGAGWLHRPRGNAVRHGRRPR